MNAPAHCESCGSTDHEDLHTGDQGYTACCNELICDGRGTSRFGTEKNFKRACCWAKATELFGGDKNVPDMSCRLP